MALVLNSEAFVSNRANPVPVAQPCAIPMGGRLISSRNMNHIQIFLTQTLSIGKIAAFGIGILQIVTTATAWAAPIATDAQVRACTNTAILKLNGVPRSAIAATAASLQADGTAQVNWTTQDGGAGSCWVNSSNQVVEFAIDVAATSRFATSQVRPLTPAAGTTALVTTDGSELNVRNRPGGEVISSAANGSTLTLTGQSNGEWVEIAGGGWVSRHLLQSSEPNDAGENGAAQDEGAVISQPEIPPAEVSAAGATTAQVATAGGINVRDRPDGEVIASLTNGAMLTLTGNKAGEWVEIEGGGWVFGSYLQYR